MYKTVQFYFVCKRNFANFNLKIIRLRNEYSISSLRGKNANKKRTAIPALPTLK